MKNRGQDVVTASALVLILVLGGCTVSPGWWQGTTSKGGKIELYVTESGVEAIALKENYGGWTFDHLYAPPLSINLVGQFDNRGGVSGTFWGTAASGTIEYRSFSVPVSYTWSARYVGETKEDGSNPNPFNARVSGTYNVVRLELSTQTNTSISYEGLAAFDGVGLWIGAMGNSLGNSGLSFWGGYDLDGLNNVQMDMDLQDPLLDASGDDFVGVFDEDEVFAALYDSHVEGGSNSSEDLLLLLKQDAYGVLSLYGEYYMAALRTPAQRELAVAEFGTVDFHPDGSVDILVKSSTELSGEPQSLNADFTLSSESLTVDIERAGNDTWKGAVNVENGIAILTDLDDQDGLADDQDVDIALLVKPGDDFSLSKLFGSYTAIRMSVGTDGTNPQVMKGYLVFGLNDAVSGQLKTADQSASKDFSGTVSFVDAGPSFTLQTGTGDVLLGAMCSDGSVGVLSDLDGGSEADDEEVDLIVLIKKL
ncbi:hypothetical protein ACFL1X_01840 [Candidatus Hydrogenedentota bacterium]